MELGNWAFGNARGTFHVNRNWQDTFCEQLDAMGFDGYGQIQNGHENLEACLVEIKSEHGATMKFENDTFILMPYYWGEADAISVLPNFVYKPTGFELSWYKYALRDSYMNQAIDFNTFTEMLEHCKKSLEGGN